MPLLLVADEEILGMRPGYPAAQPQGLFDGEDRLMRNGLVGYAKLVETAEEVAGTPGGLAADQARGIGQKTISPSGVYNDESVCCRMSLLLSKGARISGRRTRNGSRPWLGDLVMGFEPGRIASRSLLYLLGAALLVAGCGDEPVEPDETPPDLTGSYTIVSFLSAFTAGETLEPPNVEGTFSLQQTSVVGQEASGTMDLTITFPTESGPITLELEGTYTNRTDGTWEQMAGIAQNLGTYSLEGSTLTVEVTEPAINVSTTVWRRL